MTALLLSLSIVLSSGRNLLSKNLSRYRFGTRDFFFNQLILFLGGAVALLLFGSISWSAPSLETIIYALIYGALLIFAQWFYTVALGGGNTALCSVVYSMGFILPTISGAIFWAESFSFLDLLGVLCAVAAILFAKGTPKKQEAAKLGFFIPLIVAMLSSGGLGIMQKIQQKSEFKDEKSMFLLIAFLFAAAVSLLSSLPARQRESRASMRSFAVAGGVGIAFGSCNLLNTALAGMLPSAVFFPTLNIGVIILTAALSIVLFKERIRRSDIFVLISGGISILLLNIGP